MIIHVFFTVQYVLKNLGKNTNLLSVLIDANHHKKDENRQAAHNDQSHNSSRDAV